MQYCDGFAIHQHESTIGIHVPSQSWTTFLPPSFPYPFRLSQSTSFGYPASCIELTPFICLTYDVYVSILFSQVIPFSPPAAAAAKSLQSCPTLCNPIDSSPPGSPVPGILQARTLEWVAISFSNAWKWKVKVELLSHVWLFVTPGTAAYQAPPSMGFSRQEYWSGVPLPSPCPSLTISKFLFFMSVSPLLPCM